MFFFTPLKFILFFYIYNSLFSIVQTKCKYAMMHMSYQQNLNMAYVFPQKKKKDMGICLSGVSNPREWYKILCITHSVTQSCR